MSLSTITALFSHSVNQVICSCLPLPHEHSETLLALKFMCGTTSSANMVIALLARSLTTQRQIHKITCSIRGKLSLVIMFYTYQSLLQFR